MVKATLICEDIKSLIDVGDIKQCFVIIFSVQLLSRIEGLSIQKEYKKVSKVGRIIK